MSIILGDYNTPDLNVVTPLKADALHSNVDITCIKPLLGSFSNVSVRALK